MAWKWKLTAVSSTVPGLDADGNPITIDLSKQGRFFAAFEVLDDADTVVDQTSLELPHDVSRAAVIERMSDRVRRMRDARAVVVSLADDVGRTVPVA